MVQSKNNLRQAEKADAQTVQSGGFTRPTFSPAGEQAQVQALFSIIAALRNGDDAARFLTDLCTPSELRALAARWQVAQLLDEGALSYRDISAQTGASTTTVGRVARFLKEEPNQGYALALALRGESS